MTILSFMSSGKWCCVLKAGYAGGKYVHESIYTSAELDTRLEKGDFFVRIELKELPLITEKKLGRSR